ncbi:MAG TPA: hypothetical protein PLS50_02705 [Candidatus Dojkabacteria bacterium]|nr:hypothetical protein [Candidatus Dojkabacteria bacterium]
MLEPWTEEQLHDVYENGVTAYGLLMLIDNLEINQSPGWLNLGQNKEGKDFEFQRLIRNTAQKLACLEIRYPNLNDSVDDDLYNHIIGNPTRSLIQWMQFYLLGLGHGEGIISTDKLVIICSETCVLDFIERNLENIPRTELSLEETIGDIYEGPKTCSRYLYISPTCGEDSFSSIKEIYLEYNQTFSEFTEFLSKYPFLFEMNMDTYINPTTISLQDTPILSKLKQLGKNLDGIEWNDEFKNDFANSFVFSFFLILGEEDFQDLYDERILRYWGDRFWVQDATIPRALVVTPNGLKNLANDPKKSKSNASHEYFHFFLNRYFSSESDPMGSSQYILPKWLIEGLCNVMFLTERGRTDDGFREAQINKLMNGEEELLTAQDIMNSDDVNYLHYSVFTHFIFKVLNSAIDGEKEIKSIPIRSYGITNKVLKAMKDAYGKLKIIYPPAPSNLHNLVAIEIIGSILKDSRSFNKFNFNNLMKTFNSNREIFYADYFFPEWETDDEQYREMIRFFRKIKEIQISKETNSNENNK